MPQGFVSPLWFNYLPNPLLPKLLHFVRKKSKSLTTKTPRTPRAAQEIRMQNAFAFLGATLYPWCLGGEVFSGLSSLG